MRKVAANYIISASGDLLKNGVLVTDDLGKILDIIDTKGDLKESEGVEFYNGILVPGFINTHCHLELSHLYQTVAEGTGITDFVMQVSKNRINDENLIKLAAKKADDLMSRNGIVAVGDISNSTSSIATKLKSRIYYHTFVELFGFSAAKAGTVFDFGVEKVYKTYIDHALSASIVPHSPYSVSLQLFKKILHHAVENNGILSIHNQESEGENLLYEQGRGIMVDHLKNNIKADLSDWQPTGKSSLQSILALFPMELNLLLVHNVHTSKEDIHFLKENRDTDNTYLTLCPKSNLYIENTLPPVDLFYNENLQICLGTDSLASNHSLSIIDEMKIIQDHFPSIELSTLTTWATLNGAKALKIDDKFGSFEKGKRPGVNLIKGLDLLNLKLMADSEVERII